ncbi:MAG: hypothetical protein U1D35_01535 [Paracoccaceae bacterium]|nr:hypothetical protein [Paracoccaceae bacterium]
MNVIYKSDFNEAIFSDLGSETLVISFSPRKDSAPPEFFGGSFFEKLKLSSIILRSMKNTWYIDDDFETCAQQIDLILSTKKFTQIVLYGQSMGAYGCLMYANRFSASRVIAAGPIATMDPKIERRWASDFANIISHSKPAKVSCGTLNPNIEVVALYDPKSPDFQHLKLIKGQKSLIKVEVPNSGHMVLQYLRDAGILGDVITPMIYGDFSVSKINHIIHATRGGNKRYLVYIIEKIKLRPFLQNIVLRYALRRLPGDIDLQLVQSSIEAEAGKFEIAALLIKKVYANNPQYRNSVGMAKAIANYAAAGGSEAQIKEVVQRFDSSATRNREAQLWYARYLRFVGRFNDAFAAHEFFMKCDSFDAQAHYERGLIYEKIDLPFMARKSYERSLQAEPSFSRASQALKKLPF